MSTAASVPEPVGVRDRVIEAASRITCETGWSDLTMAKVAARVGVSRQTVYNELGSKPALGQAMVLRELERFLAVVAAELDAHDDLVEGIRSAAEQILVMARDNPLLHAVLSSAHGSEPGGSNDLLPFLTTVAEPLVAAATAMIAEHVTARHSGLGLSDRELEVAIDSIVRLVLSHVMQPGRSPADTADDIAWISARVLAR